MNLFRAKTEAMKFGVVIFPGSNCDQDIIYVLETLMGQEVERLWHKDPDLKGCEFIVLPGGFSYGDYLRSGAIARFSPIMEQVIEFSKKGGYVLGVCNGFQVLCEAGLLPGALLHNVNHKFICKNIHLVLDNANTMLTRSIEADRVLEIPIAHGEGRYYLPEDELETITANGQVLFRYCDADGRVTPEANPNGSVGNIAGVCNSEKNVFGMMPHPERASNMALGNIDGRIIFESILDAVAVK